jgi:hypothetical protein
MSELLLERWFPPDSRPEPIATLFPAAMKILVAEDHALRDLFENSPCTRSRELDGHPGLAYGLYETTLVYLLFKAWLPHVDLEWESAYSNKPSHHCDLVVHSPHLFFEAKWWGSMQGKTLNALGIDVQRLREVHDADGRFLLTFWWNFDKDAAIDEQEIDGLAQRLNEGDLHPRYYARFRTVVRHKRQGDAHFSMCVFEIS